MTSETPATRPSSAVGEIIDSLEDDYGVIDICEKNGQRFVCFGNAVEQSVMQIDAPQALVHVYTQAMMLATLLRPEPMNAAVLGVGGGSLVRALLGTHANLKVVGIEYRKQVIELAKRHFGLCENERLALYCEDARHHLNTTPQNYSLLFTDLYLADGAHPDQTQEDFYTLCQKKLDENGILVVNRWSSEYSASQENQRIMQAVFKGRALHLAVQGGNIITFAFNSELLKIHRNHFFDAAQKLGDQLACPLQKLARNFWRQNARALQTGRFVRG